MSFLDNNPFTRPSPNFSTNLTSNNFYTNYDYISSNNPTTEYQYGSKSNTNYFGSNVNKQSAEYKYSRAIEDSPFINGKSNFLSSNASLGKNYQQGNNYETLSGPNNYRSSTSYNQLNAQKDYKYQDPLTTYTKKYNYEPRTSGPELSYNNQHQSYFKKDKYDNNFRKSNFQTDIDIQIGKARQNEVDKKYQIGSSQKQIKNILENNPFHRNSLKSVPPKYSTPSVAYNSINDYRVQPNKYQALQYKASYLTTSNVNLVPGFGGNQPYSLYQNEKLFEKNDNYSERGSGQTFINKFDDLISSSDNNISQRQYSKKSSKKQLSQVKEDPFLQKSQKSKLSNPFERDSNPFATKKSNPFQRDSHFYDDHQNIYKKDSINSQNNSKPFKKDSNIYQKDIHSFGNQQQKPFNKDMFEYQKIKDPKNSMYNSKNTQKQYQNIFALKQTDNVNKYDQFIFKRSNKQLNQQQNKYPKKYDERVQEQFQKWINQSSRFSQNNIYASYNNKEQTQSQRDKFLIQPISHIIKDNHRSQMKDSLNSKIKNSITKNQFDNNSERHPQRQRQSFQWNQFQEQQPKPKQKKKQSMLTANFGSFMKQSLQNNNTNSNNNKETNLVNLQKVNQIQQKKNSKIIEQNIHFRFSGQRFTDSDPEEEINYKMLIQQTSQKQKKLDVINPNFKRSLQSDAIQFYTIKTENNFFKQENNNKLPNKFQPRLSGSLSQASSIQLNTEQKIDQKLDKYRYNYDKKTTLINNNYQQIQKQEIVKLNDFIDISLDQQNSNQLPRGNQSFQFNSSLNHNQHKLNQSLQTGNKKRSPLKNRIKNDSFSYQAHQKANQSLQQRYVEKDNSIKNSNENIQLNSKKQIKLINKGERQNSEKQLLVKKLQSQPLALIKQQYQFKTLDQFQKQYEYKMKNSGFDFGQDQFAQSQKQLQFQKQDQQVYKTSDAAKNTKILVVQYGYDVSQQNNDFHKNKNYQQRTFNENKVNKNEPQQINYNYKIIQLSQKQFFGKDININKNHIMQQQDDFVPTFKIKQSSSYLDQQSLQPQNSRNQKFQARNSKTIKQKQIPINTIKLKNQAQKLPKRQNIQQKVIRMKIYQSSNQEFRTSGEYQQNANYLNQNQIYKKFQSKSSKNKNYSNKNQQKQSSDQEYKSPFSKKIQQKKLKNQHKQIQTKRQNYYIDESSEEDLEQTKKNIQYGYKNYSESQRQQQKYKRQYKKQSLKRDQSHEFYRNSNKEKKKPYNQQPVRDSYEQNSQKKMKKLQKQNKNNTPNFKKTNNQKRVYPSLLEFKGQIYHRIQCV